jgi:hypothetical protein
MGFGVHRQCPLVDSRLKRRTATAFSATCAAVSLGLLLVGLAYYLSCRHQLPSPLARLGIPPHVLPLGAEPNVSLSSLPTFVHVAAFSLLTCALFRPTLPLALAASAGWTTLNVLWELSCAIHQAWLRLAYLQAGVAGMPPRCTYDKWDVGAALLGAAAAPLMTLCFVSVRSRRAR